uniref:Uncharacterized protein n=1 Tax=Mycena chlorophos TaxID=658473 RepID=A0ABQ0KUC2_MYCCL|nr:predicted protein [Mycena chlorophos]
MSRVLLTEPYNLHYLGQYTEEDLRCFVERQLVKWTFKEPYETASRDILAAELVKKSNGFTRDGSPLSSVGDSDNEDASAAAANSIGDPSSVALEKTPDSTHSAFRPLDEIRRRKAILIASREGAESLDDWLKLRIAAMDGYEEFSKLKKRMKNQGRTNDEALAYWKFIETVSSAFAEQPSLFKGRKFVTHKNVYAALGVRHAAYNAALRCVLIIEKYGPDGQSPDEDVIEQLHKEQGSTVLSKFLHNFAKERGE